MTAHSFKRHGSHTVYSLITIFILSLLGITNSNAGFSTSKKPTPRNPSLEAKAADSNKWIQLNGKKASGTTILARLKTPTGTKAAQQASVAKALSQNGLKIDRQYSQLPGLHRLKLTDDGNLKSMSKDSLLAKIKQLKASGLYEYAEPDWQVHLLQTPTDAALGDGRLWGLRNQGQSGGVSGIDVNAQSAWSVTTGSPTVVVGVIDTGIRHTHQDLSANMWTNPGEIPGNGQDDDNNGYVDDVHGINAITGSGDPMDDQGHGSHCAGTIAATAFGGGPHVGVAYNVRLMGLKFLSASGGGATSDAISCIDYAISKGADILSNSWGGGGYSQSLASAISRANNAGMIFIAAAGNSASNNDITPHYPSNYSTPNVVSVAAIDRRGQLASFSCYGTATVDLAAPGVAIYSCSSDSDFSYMTISGTSMATPHVSGVAALLKSQYPSISVAEMKNRLINTARPLSSLAGIMVSGGTVDAAAALNVSEDGNLELGASSRGDLVTGVSNDFFVSVSDLSPVTGATVTGSFNGGSTVPFFDNGIAPDSAANDGVYSVSIFVPNNITSAELDVDVTASGKNPASEQFSFSYVSPPPNDFFASRIILNSGTTQTTGSNSAATTESGEIIYPSVAGGKTVWWQWTASTTGTATISTTGSNYDTTLAIHRGTDLNSLLFMGSNDDSGGLQSAVSFPATAGTTYAIQVDGYGGAEGDIQLNYPSPGGGGGAEPPSVVTQPASRTVIEGDPFTLFVSATGTAPLAYQWKKNGGNISGANSANYSVTSASEADEGSYTVVVSNSAGSITSNAAYIGVDPVGLVPDNDNFANAEELSGASGRIPGFNIRATGESGESNHAGVSTPLASVWYQWTAPSNGTLDLETSGSDYDTTLAGYRGSSVGTLTELASNDDASGVQSAISFPVSAGVTYSIAVDGFDSAEGQITLDYAFTPDTTGIPNDNFAGRTVLNSNGASVSSHNIGATGQTGETNHVGSSTPLASVWWSWTATQSAQVVISTAGSDFDTTLAVYRGSSVTSLTQVAANDDSSGLQSMVSFVATAGTTYAIAVDGYGYGEGSIELAVTPQTSSDDHGDSRGTATSIAIGSTTPGNLEHGADQDFFRIVVTEPGILNAGTLGGLDTIGYLLDSNGNILSGNDDAGANPGFLVSYLISPGTYYVAVIGYSEVILGGYQLACSLDPFSVDIPGSPALPPSSSNVAASSLNAGKYSGVLRSSDDSQLLGYFKSLKLSSTGKFSAKAIIGNQTLTIKGVLDPSGAYSAALPFGSNSTAFVNIQLVRTTGGGYKFEGTITIDSQTINISAVRGGSVGSMTGAYTLLIPGDEDEPTQPQGHGYGMMSLTSTGAAKIKGVLGDGSKWTAKCLVTPDGEMPLYAALYRKTGFLGGMVRFRNVTNVSDCDAVVHWFRPGGHDIHRDLIGSRFSPRNGRLISGVSNSAPNVSLIVGPTTQWIGRSWPMEWTSLNRFNYTGLEKIKMTLKTTTGQLKGKVPLNDLKWKAEGVVFQKQNTAAGLLYTKGGDSRSMNIVPIE